MWLALYNCHWSILTLEWHFEQLTLVSFSIRWFLFNYLQSPSFKGSAMIQSSKWKCSLFFLFNLVNLHSYTEPIPYLSQLLAILLFIEFSWIHSIVSCPCICKWKTVKVYIVYKKKLSFPGYNWLHVYTSLSSSYWFSINTSVFQISHHRSWYSCSFHV